ncbi:hypothetical protein Y032_0113g385 [Ancylostoma ceylanicum]|uniref:Uncharacterized protein n=1 Tax=Ancylostoma ceylanicum TaxID=53326 RepID=A0A016TCQ5_9BILA|nr:hypothetical protein Y032_0113g385 [Ancylostoma ceylanicum]
MSDLIFSNKLLLCSILKADIRLELDNTGDIRQIDFLTKLINQRLLKAHQLAGIAPSAPGGVRHPLHLADQTVFCSQVQVALIELEESNFGWMCLTVSLSFMK